MENQSAKFVEGSTMRHILVMSGAGSVGLMALCTGQVQQDTFFREFSNSIGDRPWFAECSLSRL